MAYMDEAEQKEKAEMKKIFDRKVAEIGRPLTTIEVFDLACAAYIEMKDRGRS